MAEEGVPEAVAETVTAPEDDLQKLLHLALSNGCLIRGIHQVTKAIESKKAQVCVVSKGCSEPGYLAVIQALCKEHGIPLIETDHDSKTIGQWSGLCKYDLEGVPRNIVGATSVAITAVDEQSEVAKEMQALVAALK